MRPTSSLLAFAVLIALLYTATPSAAKKWCPRDDILLRFTGQALIRFDLRSASQTTRQKFRQLREELNNNNPAVVFTDFETAVNGTDAALTSQPANNNPTAVHISPPSVLDALIDYGFNVFTTSNNHINDLGIPGQISTLNEMNRRKMLHSGNGFNLNQARAPAVLKDEGQTIAFISFVSGSTLDKYGGIATDIYPGVNAVQFNTTTLTFDAIALANLLSDIRAAAATYKIVIVSHHNHYPSKNVSVTEPWWSALTHSIIDNGASMFVGHGPTALRTIEIYKNRPIFYGLGSFIFQTSKGPGAYPEASTFESVIADVCVDAPSGNITRARLLPITLNSEGEGTAETPDNAYDHWHATLGVPELASLADATSILTDLQAISPGLPLTINNGVGWINFPQSSQRKRSSIEVS